MDSSHSFIVKLLLLAVFLCPFPNRIACQQTSNASLTISTHDATVIISESQTFSVQLNGHLSTDVNVTFQTTSNDMIDIIPRSFQFKSKSEVSNVQAILIGRSPGHIEVTASAQPSNMIDTTDAFIRIIVANSAELISISAVIGWCYFVAWSISFYPQIYTNFRRKSVIGLNFDYLALNIVGFLMYAIFNIGLYAIPEMQNEYSQRFPRGLNPVQLNDVFFAFHATFATIVTICQCFVYDRADQRVSIAVRTILIAFAAVGIVSIVLVFSKVIYWLDVLYVCSYIKLSITLIKYVPQAYMNYSRKSTIGWSIGNVLLDFTGGILSMLQMLLNAYNYDDWASIFGDPTKFGLGAFSVLFDILFLVQHYVFYSESKTKLMERV